MRQSLAPEGRMQLRATPALPPANNPAASSETSGLAGDRTPAVRWFKEWVPQDLLATGGKCMVLKWVTEDMLNALKEKLRERENEEPEPEPTSEVLFLCSYEGCGKTFFDVAALRKHSHIHGERQFACHYEGCGKKFMDSSKLKRHFLTHTGERAHICTYEGCGKAFSLYFNLRAHMRTHSQENYHICPHEDCGKRYAHSYKLQAHIKARHEKNAVVNMTKRTLPVLEVKANAVLRPTAAAHSDRPHACPYEGCGKSYIHGYKLRLHLRREHPGHYPDEDSNRSPAAEHGMDDASARGAYPGKVTPRKNLKRSKTSTPSTNLHPSKVVRRAPISSPTSLGVPRERWAATRVVHGEDSEETRDDCENAVEDVRREDQGANDDDEETEDEA